MFLNVYTYVPIYLNVN